MRDGPNRAEARLSPLQLTRIAARAGAADRAETDLGDDIAELAAAGLMAAALPAGDGGSGLGTEPAGVRQAVTTLRALGRANLSLARLYEGHVNAVKLVALYAGDETRHDLFAKVRSGACLGVWGADGASPVEIVDRNGRRELSGQKRFASGLGLVSLALVTARMSTGTQLVCVPVEDRSRADPAAWRAAGMRATLSGTYDFDGLEVGRDVKMIGTPDDFYREPHFEGGVWRYCAAHLGGAEALYDAMLDSLARRGQSAAPLQQTRIAAAATACETARLWIDEAAGRVEREDPRDGDAAAAYALLAREVTERACLEVIAVVEAAIGTAAHMEGTPIERIRRDLSLFVRQAAPDAKRARAVEILARRNIRPEAL